MRRKLLLGTFFLFLLIGCSSEKEIVPANTNETTITAEVTPDKDSKNADTGDTEDIEEKLNFGYFREWPENMMEKFEYCVYGAEKTVVKDGKEIVTYLYYTTAADNHINIEEHDNPEPLLKIGTVFESYPVKIEMTGIKKGNWFNLPGDEAELTEIRIDSNSQNYNTEVDPDLILASKKFSRLDVGPDSDRLFYRKTGYYSEKMNGVATEILYEPAFCSAGGFPLAVWENEYLNDEVGDHLYKISYKAIPQNFEATETKYYYDIPEDLIPEKVEQNGYFNDKEWIRNLSYTWEKYSTTKYEYDNVGMLIRETERDEDDQLIYAAEYSYEDDRLSVKTELDRDGEQHIYSYSYDIDKYGNVRTAVCTDENGKLVSKYRYLYKPTEESREKVLHEFGWN